VDAGRLIQFGSQRAFKLHRIPWFSSFAKKAKSVKMRARELLRFQKSIQIRPGQSQRYFLMSDCRLSINHRPFVQTEAAEVGWAFRRAA
jgi:hypothetical protein